MAENQNPLLFGGIKSSDQIAAKKKRSFGEIISSEEKKGNILFKPEGDHVLDKWGGMPDPNYRFQLFSICVDYKIDKPGKLYGYVEIDGSGSGFVSLFDCSPDYSTPIHNKGSVPLSDPTAVSALTDIKVGSQLYVSIEGDDDQELEVFNEVCHWDMSEPSLRIFDYCGFVESYGRHGQSTLYYVISKRAVEATMEISVHDEGFGRNVAGKIVAYYGNFNYNCYPDERRYYRVTLFEAESILASGKISLQRSVMGVPYKSTLVIDSCLYDKNSGEAVIEDLHEFSTQPADSSSYRLKGNRGCYLDLTVHWKYEAPLAGDHLL